MKYRGPREEHTAKHRVGDEALLCYPTVGFWAFELFGLVRNIIILFLIYILVKTKFFYILVKTKFFLINVHIYVYI